jgi:hypothetical protein
MDCKEAYAKLMTIVSGLKAQSCYEYKDIFAFHMVPMNFEKGERLLNCSYSVNKTTGQVRDFKPFHIPIDEYKAGKKIEDFM